MRSPNRAGDDQSPDCLMQNRERDIHAGHHCRDPQQNLNAECGMDGERNDPRLAPDSARQYYQRDNSYPSPPAMDKMGQEGVIDQRE